MCTTKGASNDGTTEGNGGKIPERSDKSSAGMNVDEDADATADVARTITGCALKATASGVDEAEDKQNTKEGASIDGTMEGNKRKIPERSDKLDEDANADMGEDADVARTTTGCALKATASGGDEAEDNQSIDLLSTRTSNLL